MKRLIQMLLLATPAFAGAITSGSVGISQLFVPDDTFWGLSLATSDGAVLSGGGTDNSSDLAFPRIQPPTAPWSIDLTLNGVPQGSLFPGGTNLVFDVSPFSMPSNPPDPYDVTATGIPFTMSGTLVLHSGSPGGPIGYTETVSGYGTATFRVLSTPNSPQPLQRGYVFTFVPEPGSGSMLTAAGIALLGWRTWRCRSGRERVA